MSYEPSQEEMEKLLKSILENGMYIPELDQVESVSRTQDDHDHDGKWRGMIEVSQLPYGGDIAVLTVGNGVSPLRFRAVSGGTQSPRTHTALRILMLAIILDQEERPEPPC